MVNIAIEIRELSLTIARMDFCIRDMGLVVSG